MLRNFGLSVCGLALGLVCGCTDSLSAQDAVLSELYGRGVHHYFSGRSNEAVTDLSAAIDGGTKDPRAFYFRALAEMKMGHQFQATADLQMGAALESADINQFYPVGKSLERVQGSSRMSIERYRSLARAQAFQRQRDNNAVRYEQRRRAEGEVLRAPAVVPPAVAPPAVAPPAGKPKPGTTAPKPGPAVPVPAPEPDEPFGEEDEKKEDAKKPAATDEPAEEMPAEDMPAEEPAAEDAPAEEMPAEETPAAEAPAADTEDPFGEPPAKGDAAAEDKEPAAPAAPKAEDDDPFGDDPKSVFDFRGAAARPPIAV